MTASYNKSMKAWKTLEGAAAAAAVLVAALCVGVSVAGCADDLGTLALRYSAMSNRVYVEGGRATMADLLASRTDVKGIQKGPIWHFDQDNNRISETYTGTYYIEASIHIVNGAMLSIDGSLTNSDIDPCETLLMASNSNLFVHIRAHGGNLDVKHTHIFSWDILKGAYDTNLDDGRSFLSAITEKITGREEDTCPHIDSSEGSSGRAKNDMGNANMDIVNSEVAYLGYDASESYGVSYKARGLCKDLSNEDIYDDDNGLDYGVTGDIINSEIHHNRFGHYSWGHDGGRFQNNIVHDNEGYGFDPHDDSDKISIIGNTVYNNGWHGIIASKRCTDLIIADNTVYNNGKNGIMLHRSCDRATVKNNYSYGNVDAGLALFESSDCEVFGNLFSKNLHGVRFSNGANRNNVFDNVIQNDLEGSKYAFYMYRGNDEVQAEGNTNGHPKDNKIYENQIYNNNARALYVKEADDNTFEKNEFVSGSFAKFVTATGNIVQDNIFPEGFYFDTSTDTCFGDSLDSQAEPLCG